MVADIHPLLGLVWDQVEVPEPVVAEIPIQRTIEFAHLGGRVLQVWVFGARLSRDIEGLAPTIVHRFRGKASGRR
jgi:hypothetical protein